jgi:hypothetical protein
MPAILIYVNSKAFCGVVEGSDTAFVCAQAAAQLEEAENEALEAAKKLCRGQQV